MLEWLARMLGMLGMLGMRTHMHRPFTAQILAALLGWRAYQHLRPSHPPALTCINQDNTKDSVSGSRMLRICGTVKKRRERARKESMKSRVPSMQNYHRCTGICRTAGLVRASCIFAVRTHPDPSQAETSVMCKSERRANPLSRALVPPEALPMRLGEPD